MRNPTESRPCELRLSHLTRWLGVELEPGQLRQLLSELGYVFLRQEDDYLYLEHKDIQSAQFREIDVIESLGRLLGYDEIRAQWPSAGFSIGRRDRLEEFKDRLRKILVSLGCNEAYNEGFLRASELTLWPSSLVLSTKAHAQTMHRLSLPELRPRPSLLPALFKNLAHNESQQVETVRLFEMGKIFQQEGTSLREQISLAVVLAGRATEPLQGAAQFFSFQDMKGLVETLLYELGLRNFAFEAITDSALWDSKASLSIRAKEELLGFVGSLRQEVTHHFGCMSSLVFAMELDLERLFTRLLTLSTPIWFELKPKVTPSYPAIRKNFTVAVPQNTPEGAVRWILEGEKRIENVFLTEQIFESQKKVFKYEITLRDWNKLLTSDETDEMLGRLKARCAQELRADVTFF